MMEMAFTGERYVPTVQGAIRYEHLHRYALALEFVSGKAVLDIASGEGYGSAILSKVASSVVGVDIDSSCISFSRKKYEFIPKLEFLVGACDAFPLANESVDVVTSFETIEHHDKHDEMMQEIKRVLKPGGTLIISSPNRLTYSEQPKSLSSNPNNPFHVKEPYDYQFISLLNRHFKSVKIYGQRLGIGSFVFPLKDGTKSSLKSHTTEDGQVAQKVSSLAEPLYFIAICSDDSTNTQNSLDSVYIDRDDDVLMEIREQLIQSSGQLPHYQIKLQETERELQASQVQLQQTHALLAHYQVQLQQTETQLQASQVQLQQTETQLQASQVQLQQTETQLQASQVQLQQTETLVTQFGEQLHQTEEVLQESLVQLYKNQQELQQSNSQLSEIQKELKLLQSLFNQVQTDFAESQSQLHQNREELKCLELELQSQVHKSEGLLKRYQSQLHQIQEELADSQSQLYQNREELKCLELELQSQVHKSEGLLKRYQSQLHQTQEELADFQSQLHQTQEELADSQSQLHQTQEELADSQSQLHQTQEELADSQSQLHQTQEELADSQSQLHHTQEELADSQSQLHHTQEELADSQSQLHHTQNRLARLLFKETLVGQTEGENKIQYILLVWDAWYAYQQGDVTLMTEYLHKSLQYKSFLRTETVIDWLEHFSNFSQKAGHSVNMDYLISSPAWQQLMKRVAAVKVALVTN
jgi:SAM-dependent methyltransferase/septal ring factor EnvC (AmiA/AmiB activator)